MISHPISQTKSLNRLSVFSLNNYQPPLKLKVFLIMPFAIIIVITVFNPLTPTVAIWVQL